MNHQDRNPEPGPDRDCPSRKVRYTSKHNALVRLRWCGRRMRAYFCNRCHGWHTTKEEHSRWRMGDDREESD